MKEIARLENLTKRNSLSKEVVERKSRLVEEKFLKLPEFEKAKLVMVYYGVKSEVATKGIIEKALKQGKRVVLPVTNFENNSLKPVEITSLEELKKTKFGLMEPRNGKEVKKSEIELIVVPGVAFDGKGSRIGTGRGFYDSLLGKISTKVPLVGLCFEENFQESLPSESHDVKMNIVVTDRQVLRCK